MDVTKTHIAYDLKHDSPLISCRFDPTGRFVFAGAQDFRVWRWEPATGVKTELAAANAWVRGMAFSSDAATLVTAGYDGRLIWWPAAAEKPEPLRIIEGHAGWARTVAVSPNNKLLASAGNDLVIRLWNMENGDLVREIPGHESHIYSVVFHPDGKHLASSDLMSHIMEWDIETGKRLRQWKAESLVKYDPVFKAHHGGFRGMVFSADGKRLACSGITNVTNAFAGIGNPSVVEFDWEKGEQTIEHLSKAKHQGVAWGVAIHPEGFVIGASGGGAGGFLLFWKSDGKEEFHQFKLPNTARDLNLSSDGLHLATAHHDGHLRICRMEAKAE